jgi:hypothetical protein
VKEPEHRNAHVEGKQGTPYALENGVSDMAPWSSQPIYCLKQWRHDVRPQTQQKEGGKADAGTEPAARVSEAILKARQASPDHLSFPSISVRRTLR